MKRAISILMILIMLLSFVGCEENSESTANSPASGSVNGVPNVGGISDKSPTVEDQSVEVRDVIKFVTYEQDGNTSNGREDIEWIVLAQDGDRSLIISKNVIDVKSFNDTESDSNWADCSLREWLNNSFIVDAFSLSEKSKILDTDVAYSNLNNTKPGEKTVDKLFLLSMEDVEAYFLSDKDKQVTPTKYAIKNGAVEKDSYCMWYLRTFVSSKSVAYINSDGKIIYMPAQNMNSKAIGIRPAMWIKNSANSSNELSISYGDRIKFGHYEQDNISSNGKEEIEWIVLDTIGSKALVISEKCLDCQQYSSNGKSITLRNWLNSDFLNNAFDESEKSKIATSSADDKVFLLNRSECAQYFKLDFQRRAVATPYAISKGDFIDENEYCFWWVWQESYYSYTPCVTFGGDFDAQTQKCGNLNGVRPAMWITMEENMTSNKFSNSLKKWDVLKFGEYEQDNNTTNGKEDIEWLVLRVEGTKVLVISLLGLIEKTTNEKDEAVTWETCDIRKWLNSEFIEKSFSDTEKQRIFNTDNSEYGEKELLDKVFLLSESECKKYFSSADERRTIGTLSIVDASYPRIAWPLRLTGYANNITVMVNTFGEICWMGEDSNVTYNLGCYAVRPVMWIETNPDNSSEGKTIKKDSVDIGSIVKFGTYEQDGDEKNGKEKIEWIVLAKDNGKFFVTSRFGLCCQPYNTKDVPVTWETCTLRKWLNETFIDSAFSKEEISKILTTEVTVEEKDEDFGSNLVNVTGVTSDKIFLLSRDEAKEYLLTRSDVQSGCYMLDQAYAWWLRTVSSNGDAMDKYSIEGVGWGSPNTSAMAVRPAMWITLE